MLNVLLTILVLAIIGGAVAYIVRAKRRGQKCIGCPAGGSGSCSCHSAFKEEACHCGCVPDQDDSACEGSNK